MGSNAQVVGSHVEAHGSEAEATIMLMVLMKIWVLMQWTLVLLLFGSSNEAFGSECGCNAEAFESKA